MARSKFPEITAERILEVSKRLFIKKGYEATKIQDIVDELEGLTKGAIYHHYKSKEEIIKALVTRLLYENIPFDEIKVRNDLNALQKIQEVMVLCQADAESRSLGSQITSILKEPRVFVVAMEVNQQILTPIWVDLIEEGKQDGSIQTEYVKELSELLPLLVFRLSPSIYPDTTEELRHKFYFTIEMLTKMGLPVLNKDMKPLVERHLVNITPE